MCHFMRLENGTGRFLNAEFSSIAFLSGKIGLADLYVQLTEDNKTHYRLHADSSENSLIFDRLIRFSREGENPRREKLFMYHDTACDMGRNVYEYDLNVAFCDMQMKGKVPDGCSHTAKPLFCILTEKELTRESLDDLRRIEFNL